MATTLKWLLGSVTSLITTGLNSLTNNSIVTPVNYDNTVGGTGDGYTQCDLELVVTFGTNPTASTGFSLWFLESQDGTNYEDGDNTPTTPARAPDCVFPVRVVTTAQRIIRRVPMPWGKFSVLLKNDNTGQTTAASGNTLKMRPVTLEGV